jgi:hypothetical protein
MVFGLTRTLFSIRTSPMAITLDNASQPSLRD